MRQKGLSRVEFVRLGALAGLAPAAVTLAGCGGDEPSGGGGGGESGGETTSGTGRTRAEPGAPEATGGTGSGGDGYIARESEVSPGSAVEFEDGGEPAILIRLDGGGFAAYSAVCTHQGCTVAYNGGAGTLDCPCHGSVFDPASGGSVRQGPAESPLPEIPLAVRGGEVRRA